jgi:hypothetical protein
MALTGSSVLIKMYRALLIMDFASMAVAERDGFDPNPVVMVESFKAALGPFDT